MMKDTNAKFDETLLRSLINGVSEIISNGQKQNNENTANIIKTIQDSEKSNYDPNLIDRIKRLEHSFLIQIEYLSSEMRKLRNDNIELADRNSELERLNNDLEDQINSKQLHLASFAKELDETEKTIASAQERLDEINRLKEDEYNLKDSIADLTEKYRALSEDVADKVLIDSVRQLIRNEFDSYYLKPSSLNPKFIDIQIENKYLTSMSEVESSHTHDRIRFVTVNSSASSFALSYIRQINIGLVYCFNITNNMSASKFKELGGDVLFDTNIDNLRSEAKLANITLHDPAIVQCTEIKGQFKVLMKGRVDFG